MHPTFLPASAAFLSLLEGLLPGLEGLLPGLEGRRQHNQAWFSLARHWAAIALVTEWREMAAAAEPVPHRESQREV